MIRTFKSSPLPFRGQKRYYVKRFASVLNECQDIKVVVDLFGGSGLLSRVAKDCLPQARVIYNDYDYFCKRIEHIDETNELCARIAPMVKDVPEDRRIPETTRQAILRLLRDQEKTGFCDYITLSGSLLFSGNWAKNYAEFERRAFYNRSVRTHYDASGYLDGLEIAHQDYKELFAAYANEKDVLFLLDPPYLQTDVSAYSSDTYWQLKDYLDVLQLLKGTKYILFTSGKSQIIELCQWINSNFPDAHLLQGVEKWEQDSRVNDFTSYKDIMLAKI